MNIKISIPSKKIIVLTFLLFTISIDIYSDSDSLSVRCRTALQENITDGSLKKTIILIEEIKKDEDLYLKSGLYSDMRQFYERLSVKLGDYRKIKVKPKKVEIADKDIDEAIDLLRERQATYVTKPGKAEKKNPAKGIRTNSNGINKARQRGYPLGLFGL
ncbi:MAG: hypothetical protein MUF15_12395 [Acidobacteria bacterium]|nr:hypothetical protein [Acidobacteriota bacterium]